MALWFVVRAANAMPTTGANRRTGGGKISAQISESS